MLTLSDLLKSAGLERYTNVFAENDVDFEALRLLSDGDLESLGLSLGSRRLLQNALARLDGASNSTVFHQDDAQSGKPVEPRISSEDERRQLTVLFCDMAGFTELSTRVDPEVLQGIIRTYENTCAACITRYDGYVYQRLGDGIVAYFGFPLVHEGEAERAIHAGLSIIDSLAKLDVPVVGRIQVRIGIASGLMVVSSKTNSATGETMNLAARLQEKAPIGKVVVSESVRRLAGDKFIYENLGQQTLKGFSNPATAHRILRVSDNSSRFTETIAGGLSPMVGREQEIGVLTDRWNRVQHGEGQVVVLSGEPGIGKSRVVVALREQLLSRSAGFLLFQCSPYHANTAFYPLIDHLERALMFGKEETNESKLEKLEAMVVGQYARPREDVRYIAAMLSIPAEASLGPTTMAPQRFKDETFRALVDLTKAIARKQAVVMLFEDAHWIDPTSLALLDQLIAQAIDVPLLLILTHRPEFTSNWNGYSNVTKINLSKLPRAQCGLLVSRLAKGKTLPNELFESILAKTEGVPLFVEEVTRTVLESGGLREVGDTYVYDHAVASFAIPATLRDSLMVRLDRSAEAKEIAQIGAVIGKEFGYALLKTIVPKSEAELGRALQRLVNSGLVFKRGQSPGVTYTFKHALVRDVAYDSLLKSRRKELHATIASAIEEHYPGARETVPEIMAQHFSAAGQANNAISLWRTAAMQATRRMALKEAISHLHNAMTDVAALEPSIARDRLELDLHASLGTTYMLAKGWAAPEVEHAYARANELSVSLTNPDDAVRTLWGICVFHLVRGEIEYACRIGIRIMNIANESGSRRARLVAHMLGVQLCMYSGKFAEARTHWAVADQLYSSAEDLSLISHFSTDLRLTVRLHGAQILWILGFPNQALKQNFECYAIARSLSHPYSLSWALTWGAMPKLYRGDYQDLLKSVNEGIHIAEEHGFAYTAAIGMMARGWVQGQSGARTEGIEEMRAGLAKFRTTGAEIVVPHFQTMLAELLGEVGQNAEALAILEAAMAQVERWGEHWQEAEIHRVRGTLFATQLRPDKIRAEACFRQAIDTASKQGAKGWELRAGVSLARLLQSENRFEEAQATLAPLLASFPEGEDTKDIREAANLLNSPSPSICNSMGSRR
ncbi:MAG: AAA family ATPase [Burkholderiales bacterium]